MLARALTIAMALMFGCEKTDHDSIDKWPRTEKGPGKLAKALSDESLDADLSAHAAANLIKPPLSKETEVAAALAGLTPARRTQVIAKLAPRLWDIARIEGDNKLPGATQIAAKDALVTIRKLGDDAVKQQIDGYLTDWYAVVSYEKRAETGHYTGPVVVRMIGPSIGKKLIDVLNGLLTRPGQDKEKFRIGEELVLAIAASGSPDGVKTLLEVAKMDRGDPRLGERVFDALALAYVKNDALFDVQPPPPLIANLDTIVAIGKDDSQPGRVVNTAIELIRATGQPTCFVPLIGMVGAAHKESRFKYVTGVNALRCGGSKAIVEVVKALPQGGVYVMEELRDTIALEISKMSPRPAVLAALRTLLFDKSTIAKWIAIETLALMKSGDDKRAIAALAGASDRLLGYWGEAGEGKADPTLGQRAKELSDKLEGAESPK